MRRFTEAERVEVWERRQAGRGTGRLVVGWEGRQVRSVRLWNRLVGSGQRFGDVRRVICR